MRTERGALQGRFLYVLVGFLAFTLAIVFLARLAMRQFGSADVRVVAAGSGAPIEGAEVVLEGRSAGARPQPLRMRFVDQGQGVYRCGATVSGEVSLKVTKSGFEDYVRGGITLGVSERLDLGTVELTPLPLAPDPTDGH